MPEFFASTPKGLVEALEKELQELNLKVLERTAGGVFFEANWEGAYKANLHSRVASRILKPVLEFTAYQPEELYKQIQNHDFTKYIKPNQTICIDATIKESKMHDQRYVAMKVKDAVVDQFRGKFGVRPDVDNNNPDLRIHVR
ncbi:MAG TPA: THUMP domain-containing protein, partial [Pseudobdellovibrionaceae bacterium]